METAILQGAPFKIFAGAAASYWNFVANKSISDWSGLAGKKIALPCGQAAACNVFMTNLLTAHNVKADSVTFIFGTAQATYQALDAGSVDAALTTAPYTYALATAGKTKAFDISSAKRYLSTQFTATTAWLEKNTSVANNFVKAMVAARDKLSALPIASDVIAAIEDFEKANGIDPSTLDQNKFLTEFATDKSWQLIPTKELINQDLGLLKGNPDLAKTAGAAKFEDLVFQLDTFKAQYG